MTERDIPAPHETIALIEIDDDGYPTSESMERFKRFEWGPKSADFFLVHEFTDLTTSIPGARIEFDDTAINDFDDPVCRIVFATGGWSGCEEIIGLMLSQFWIQHRHTIWKRGGYYEFEVPINPVKTGPIDEAASRALGGETP